MSNNKKDEIIKYIIESEEVMTKIINKMDSPNQELQAYSIRTLGNILAEAENYSDDLTKYNILEKVYPLLNNKNWEMRRDGCWLLANYVFEDAAAN